MKNMFEFTSHNSLVLIITACYFLGINMMFFISDNLAEHQKIYFLTIKIITQIIGSIFYVFSNRYITIYVLRKHLKRVLFLGILINTILCILKLVSNLYIKKSFLFLFLLFDSVIWNLTFPLIKYLLSHQVESQFLISCFFLCNINNIIAYWISYLLAQSHKHLGIVKSTVLLVFIILFVLECIIRLQESKPFEGEHQPSDPINISAYELIREQTYNFQQDMIIKNNKIQFFFCFLLNILNNILLDKGYLHFLYLEETNFHKKLILQLFNIIGGLSGVIIINCNLKVVINRSNFLILILFITSLTKRSFFHATIISYFLGMFSAFKWNSVFYHFKNSLVITIPIISIISSILMLLGEYFCIL